MKRELLLVLCAILSVRGSAGQTNPPASSPETRTPDEIRSRIAAAYERNAISSISVPHHFRVTFETLDTGGQVTGRGSIERWALSPQNMKTVTRFNDHTTTEYTSEGKRQYVDDGFGGNIMFYFTKDALLHAILPPAGIASRPPQTTNVISLAGGDMLDCQAFILEIGPRQYPPIPNDRFCVSRATGDLVLRHTQNLTIRYSDFKPFADKSIARSIEGSQGSLIPFLVNVEVLDQASLPAEQMVAPTNASRFSPEPDRWATEPEKTRPVRTDKPVAPPALKASHASGVVELFYLISSSGDVTDVETRFATSPELSSYAAQAARAQHFKPIMRDGKPIQEIASAYLTLVF